MPLGVPRSEEERKTRHERLYGAGAEPPVERLGLGPKYEDLKELVWDMLPAFPGEFGWIPPIPRGIARKIAASRMMQSEK